MVAVYSRYLPPLEELVKLLKLSADSKWLHFGKAIHAQLLIRNQASNCSDIIQLNSLIHLYVKCGQLRLARSLFDAMPIRNVVSWNALMAGYLHSGDHLEVLLLFKNMVSLQNAFPNEYVVTTVLSSCSHWGRVQEGMQCHGYLFKFGLVSHQYVKSALVHMYSRCSHVESALQVLDTVPGGHDKDVFSYNSVLSALVESERWGEAVGVLRRMMDECVVWDNVTYVNVMGLCAQAPHLISMHCSLRISSIVGEFHSTWIISV
ncbi:Tetratricopeptide-like helical domain superfamily [Sesbania bispinosa]|nr:Tetratricopeptide-like helical domain superfamily [Sesbania bispinosa]